MKYGKVERCRGTTFGSNRVQISFFMRKTTYRACPGPPRNSRRSRCDQDVEVKVTRQRWAPGCVDALMILGKTSPPFVFWLEIFRFSHMAMEKRHRFCLVDVMMLISIGRFVSLLEGI